MTRRLYTFKGGLKLQAHKTSSCSQPSRQASLPARLILPLKQHIGDYPKPCVEIGERVLKGQLIAVSSAAIASPVHASSSGVISAIEAMPVPHPSGQSDLCMVIDTDGKDESVPLAAADVDRCSQQELIDLIYQAGIVGLGGATFPTAAKLKRGQSTGIETLVINGVECEPYISCDDMMMRERPAEIIRGVQILQTILTPKTTQIAMEDNKPEAIAAMQAALARYPLSNTELVVIPTIYPSGGEKQLIQILTGREIPQNRLAFDIGFSCHNVGTCAAITRAIDQGEAVISRMVTISGDNIKHPGNWDVRLGTPINHLVELAGGYLQADPTLVMGGPMMGITLLSDQLPIVKASNNILVMRDQQSAARMNFHDECVRCSNCTDVCPAQLLPQQLYWHARANAHQELQEYHLFDCIECGCCSLVCPSQIPLVQYYRAAKSEIKMAQQALLKSDHARVRFEFREQRLLRKKQQEEERRKLKREALQKKRPKIDGKTDPLDPVQQALARVKARKQKQQIETDKQQGETDAQ
jgi:electron transport complex protein RnfC